MINAREYLRAVRIAEKRIRLNTQQVQHLWDQVLSISAPMDKEQVTHTKNTDVMGETVAAIIDIQKEIDRQTSELYKKQREAYILFEMISPESAEILMEYFFGNKTVSVVARTIHLSKRQTQRRLNNALAEFQTLLDRHGNTIAI